MAYSTKADCERVAGGSQRLAQLTDVEDTGSFVQSALDAAIAAADSWIDSYLQRRVAVPLAAPVPAEITRISAAEAVYMLTQNRATLITAQDVALHDQRAQYLVDISTGKASPGVDPLPPKSTNVTPQSIDRDPTDDDSRDAYKGFV